MGTRKGRGPPAGGGRDVKSREQPPFSYPSFILSSTSPLPSRRGQDRIAKTQSWKGSVAHFRSRRPLFSRAEALPLVRLDWVDGNCKHTTKSPILVAPRSIASKPPTATNHHTTTQPRAKPLTEQWPSTSRCLFAGFLRSRGRIMNRFVASCQVKPSTRAGG